MKTETVLLNFIFWEILCHTGYPTESLGFSQRKIDVDSPFCLLRGNVRGKKNPPSYELLSIWKDENPVSDKEFGESHGHSIATQGSFEFDPDSFSEVFLQFKSL